MKKALFVFPLSIFGKFFEKVLLNQKKIKARIESLAPLRRLYRNYVKKYIGYIILALILMVITALSTSAIAYTIGPAVNEVFVNKNQSFLYLTCIAIIVLYVIKTISTYIQDVALSSLCTRLQTDLRVELFNKTIHMPMKDFESDKNQKGKIDTMFFTDIASVGNSAKELFTTTVRDLMIVICLVVLVFYNDWLLACVAMLIYPLVFIPLSKAKRAAKEKYTNGQEFLQTLAGKIADITNGIKTIKVYNTEDIETRNVKRILVNLTRTTLDFAKKLALASPSMEFACGLSVALVIFLGGTRTIGGYSDAGHFFSFFGALIMVHRPARSLAGMNMKIQVCAASLERVFSYLDGLKTENLRDGITPSINNAKIRFENVNFTYNGNASQDDASANSTLYNINFEIEPNTKVAFVGLSGSGKSTIVNLLLRLYERDSGKISINDVDINDISLFHLRSNIAYVGQDNFLFDDTVKNNILYGTDANKITVKTVEEAMEKAQVNFVSNETANNNIGFNGNTLSTGQKQRIAIARALVKNSPIIIFDEATSALDAQTEHAIKETVFNNIKNKTTIIIAHRLSTIVNCDKIYVMRDGQIIEQGTHQQLLADNGLYTSLWSNLNDAS